MRIVYVGHSTTLVEVDGVVLLTDPLLRARVGLLKRLQPVRNPDRIDAVLVSHAHRDHLDLPSLARLPAGVPVVLPRGVGSLVRRRAKRTTVELSVGEQTTVGALTVRAVPAEHGRGRGGPFSRGVDPLGFVIEGRHRVYFAGDTDLFPEMAEFAPLDVALVPVAGWGPRLPAGHLGPGTAAEAVRLMRPRVAIPIHWGTYRMIGRGIGDERAAERFREEAARLAPEVDVRVLRPGEETEV